MSNANLIKGDDASNTLLGTAGRDVIYGFDPDDAAHNQASSIAATRVAFGLTQPVFVGAPPGDTGRLFIVERTGQIKILDLASGQVRCLDAVAVGKAEGTLDPARVHLLTHRHLPAPYGNNIRPI